MAKVTKNTNILIRVTEEEKELLKKAASIEEKTLSTLTMEAARQDQCKKVMQAGQ